MMIFTRSEPLYWGGLDVPLVGMNAGDAAAQLPAGSLPAYGLAADGQRLWFVAHHRQPARLHPRARPGAFQAELWRHDVAELFLADPVSGRYFEFNLAANGAWWSCEFVAPRVRAEEIDIVMPEVATYGDLAPDGAWLAAMAIPLDLLRARLDFGPRTRANVAFITGSPAPQFLSAVDLGDGPPDFHQPARFRQVLMTSWPADWSAVGPPDGLA